MCTAITYQTNHFYFGRTLDYDESFGEEVTFTPRNFPLSFGSAGTMKNHYAILGMAHVADDYPLYYDAFNEKGLAMAGLNFVGYAHYAPPAPDRDNIPHYALISWILGKCASVAQAKALLQRICITPEVFREDLPAASLHWLLADRRETITLEAVEGGLRIYPNPAGVLTNNPPFDEQMFQLNNFMHLSPEPPKNRFSSALDLRPYSRGMGALGLPGDFSSQSRFVRAAFAKLNSLSDPDEESSISQFFHILDTVSQPRGCCRLENGSYEFTRYTACCSPDSGTYYYTTHTNRQISAVQMHPQNLEGASLLRYPLITAQQIHRQNGVS